MTISGYTWAINVSKKMLPYEACIKSMLLLADEVCVTYDPRYDVPETFLHIDGRVVVIPQEFDVEHIQTEGHMLNAARSRCKGDWLIWLDLDEILHEKDIDSVLNLIRYADSNNYNALHIGFYQYVSRKYAFPSPFAFSARPKIMKNIEGVYHGIDSRWLQQRDDGTYYLTCGDGIDFVRDGSAFAHQLLSYRDLVLIQKLCDGTVTCADIVKSTEFFLYIYHYARYSMQRKAKMRQGDRFSFFVGGQHNNYDPLQWENELASSVCMSHQRELKPEGYLGEVEPSHPKAIRDWVEVMNEFMG